MLARVKQHFEKYWRSWLIALFWITAIIAFCWVALASDVFQECVRNPYYYAAYNEPEKGFALIFGDLGRAERCLGEFLVKDGEAITAFFTLVLSLSTIGLWLSTRHLWVVTRDAVALANKEFISTHRPRVRLKHAWFTDQTTWRLGGPLEINLDLVNIGNTSAHIAWINYQSLVIPSGQRLPQRPPYDEPLPVGATPITRFKTTADLPSGITLARPVCDGILDQQQVHEILWGTKRLYLIGTIEYWDHAGLRQTAFCRRLTYQVYPPASGDMGRFEKENDSDYEYDD